jgi:Xaa-Pro aminopeptidase
MRQHGADGPAFETIVAAGATASLPHYRPGNRRIRSDQAVLVDWGAVVGGYRSDLTRVFFTGTIPPKIKTIYPVVLKAQQSAIAAIRPGVHGSTVDAAAREIIGKGGYGEQFLHGTGHGVGLDIHEGPTLGRTARTPLRAGMIVTVEPGIYLPRIGGVRIEDDVLVTSDGARRVTSLTSRMKDLIVG